jgi:hypothetical protein
MEYNHKRSHSSGAFLDGPSPAINLAKPGLEVSEDQLQVVDQCLIAAEGLFTRLYLLKEQRHLFGLCITGVEAVIQRFERNVEIWSWERDQMFGGERSRQVHIHGPLNVEIVEGLPLNHGKRVEFIG